MLSKAGLAAAADDEGVVDKLADTDGPSEKPSDGVAEGDNEFDGEALGDEGADGSALEVLLVTAGDAAVDGPRFRGQSSTAGASPPSAKVTKPAEAKSKTKNRTRCCWDHANPVRRISRPVITLESRDSG